MKGSSDSDDNPTQNNNTTKVKYPLPGKITIPPHDNISTKKTKSDPFSQLCDRILSEKEKLKEGFDQQQINATSQPQQGNHDLIIYEPHYQTGYVEDYRETTEKEKEQYGLKNEGKCQQFSLNNEYLIVLVGRLPIPYTNGTKVSLYLPKTMLKDSIKIVDNKKTCSNSIVFVQNKQLVVIKRISQSGDINFLNYPYIIVDPQTLLYPSYLCSWIDCKRRISLVNYVSSQFEVNEHLVFGSACHRYMEWLLDEEVPVDNQTFSQFKEIIHKIYQSFIYDMYLINASFEDFWKYCEQSLTNIRLWVRNHIFLKKEIEVNKYQKLYLTITKVLGSQTMHRSKYFGLKGKTDGLFLGNLIDKNKNTITQVSIPFELKTGKKSSDSHKRQTDIYNMLLRESTKRPVIGLLYYSEGNFTIFRTESSQTAFETLVVHRNTIIMNLNKLFNTQKINLPAFVTNMDSCKMCQMSTHCELFHIGQKLGQEGSSKYKKKYCKSTAQTQLQATNIAPQQDVKSQMQIKDIESLFDEDSDADEQVPSDFNVKAKQNIDSLSFSEVSYITKWMRWLHYEERQVKQSLQKNAKQGFNSFVLKSQELSNFKQYFSSSLQKKLKFTIQKQMKTLEQLQNIMTHYQPSQKLRIIIQHLGIMEGCKIIKIKKHHKIVMMQVQMNNQQVPMNKRALDYSVQNMVDHDVQLERFETQQIAGMRNTIFNFVMGGNQTLKSIVLEGYVPKIAKYNQAKPQAKQLQNKIESKLKQHENLHVQQKVYINPQDISDLNHNQQQAFKKVFNSQYCTLIEGMPGTGKTQLIVKLIEKCYLSQKTVLITTFTNRALDNILERTFKSGKIPLETIIREGSRYSIDQKFEKLNSRSQTFTSIDDYKQYFDTKQLWFVTLASINIHHIPKKFDFVILDEASQSLEPACIQALSRGCKIVMIGDYKQLQPIVKSRKAQRQGMSVSLFQRLCIQYPENTISLHLQYRMNKQIMELSNTLVYDDQLQTGSQQVGNKTLMLKQNWKQTLGNEQTLTKIINPNHPVVFLNHDRVTSALSTKHRDRKDEISHVLQVEISSYLFYKLQQMGIPSHNMTIVCVYNKTVDVVMRLLKKTHKRHGRTEPFKNQGQVLTIDKSQGIDKEVIILLAQSRENINNVLLQNCRRLNVALTRAKTKLIIIGSMTFLSEMRVWEGKLSRLLEKRTYPITKSLIDHILNEFKDMKQEQNEKSSEEEINEI